jgi:DNA invertase Pin-like site-specific DNA recombinase
MIELDKLIKSMPKAYSYIRFSTPEQAKGDSLRRQLERSQKYAEDHGLLLDSSLNLLDQGLSGYTGENVSKGALGVFLKAVESGLVPQGSFLIVESLDRLSRATVLEQVGLLSNLVNSGITVVTLDNGQVLNREILNKDPMLLMISVIGMLRAHDESLRKSERVKAAWAQKRKLIGEKKLTSLCPSWLRLSPDRKSFELIPDRVELVRRMFILNADGVGQGRIARLFNQEGIAPWGKSNGWHMSYIQRILHSRAVLGEFQPATWDGTKSVPDGEAIPDYFPAIVPRELWDRVQHEFNPIPPGRIGAGMRVSNLFSGLIFDGYTGESMRHISRRSGRGPYRSGQRLYYLISDYGRLAKEDKAKATSWRYDWFEALFLEYIVRLDWAAVAQEATPQEETEIRTRLAVQHAKVTDLQRQLHRLGDLLATTDQATPKTILARITTLEKEESAAQDQLIAIAKEAAGHEARRLVLQESGDKIQALVQAGDFDSRRRLREEIRRKIQRIDVFAKGIPESLMSEQPVSAPGWPAFRIIFANKTERWVINATRCPEKDSAALLDYDPSEPDSQEAAPHVY